MKSVIPSPGDQNWISASEGQPKRLPPCLLEHQHSILSEVRTHGEFHEQRETKPSPPPMKEVWKRLNNQRRSINPRASRMPIRKKWLNKGDWSDIEIKMRCWEKPINATPSHNVQLELILGVRHWLSVESICKAFRLHIHSASDITEEIRDRNKAPCVGVAEGGSCKWLLLLRRGFYLSSKWSFCLLVTAVSPH